jgi:putative ABC transport system permease protein
MLKNFFLITARNLLRNKIFSAINILGLALGLVCSMLIFLWVRDERSMDAFHPNGKYIFQVYERQFFDGKVEASYPTQGLLAIELKNQIPEVQFASGYEHASAPGSQSTFEANGKINKMDGAFAGEDFFKLFRFPLLQGNAATSLTTAQSISISRKMAEIFFGSAAKAIGKTLRYENREDLQVTSVFENLPVNSSLQFDFLRSWVAYVKENNWVHNWGNTSPVTFIGLHKDADAVKVESKIKDFILQYQPKQEGFYMELGLQPFTERYLHSTFKDGHIDGGRIEYVHLFTIIAVFILLIACINFMNLSTARSAKRAKEVSIRKVIGARRSALVNQFIGEAVVITFLSSIIAILLAAIFLPAFNSLTGKQLALPFAQPFFWMQFIGLILLTSLVAGSYPAIFLSSLNPVQVLKTSLKFSAAAIFLRKALVVFQFSLSVILIVAMIVIYRQLDYVQTKNLGYDRDNLLYVPLEGDLVSSYSVFKEEAGKIPGVLSISKMRNSPTDIEHHTGSISWENKDPNLTISFADAVVGYDFTKTMNVKLKSGRDFSNLYGTDSLSFIVNETAVNKIDYVNPVGRSITWGNHKGKIIGVLEDFHFSSMHKAIEPLIVRLDENWSWGVILVRIKGEKTRQVIEGLENLCKKLNPKFPFAYQFSDDEYDKLYRSEQAVSKLSDYFAFLAIFISCLGLFGLATLTASQRMKEIGVRKVLGASVADILAMLTTNFLKPVVIAILIALPLSKYVMSRWLENFAYKIDIEWWMLAAAATAAITIAFLTVALQALQAALSNPVKNLRIE